MKESQTTNASLTPAHQREPVPSFAVIFRTHFWDDFVDRQFQRLRKNVGSGDAYVLVDETRGHVAGISSDKVFRLRDQELLDAGFVSAGEGSIQWFSGDVPLYMFQKAHPEYDYYVQMEYDVALNLNLDDLVRAIAKDGAELVTLTNTQELDSWPWLSTCLGAYKRSEIKNQLICFSIYSREALSRLAEARLTQAQRFRSGDIQTWPYCEGFIGTEASLQHMRMAELSSYGDVAGYVWWPPYMESELPSLQKHDFVHPVLDRDKYVASLFKNDPGIRPLLDPRSWFHRKLRKVGAAGYYRILLSKRYWQSVGRSGTRWAGAVMGTGAKSQGRVS